MFSPFMSLHVTIHGSTYQLHPRPTMLNFVSTNPSHPKQNHFLSVLSATHYFIPVPSMATPIALTPPFWLTHYRNHPYLHNIPVFLAKLHFMECLDSENRGSKLLQNVSNYFNNHHVISQQTLILIFKCVLMWNSMLWTLSLVFHCSRLITWIAKTMYTIYVSVHKIY